MNFTSSSTVDQDRLSLGQLPFLDQEHQDGDVDNGRGGRFSMAKLIWNFDA